LFPISLYFLAGALVSIAISRGPDWHERVGPYVLNGIQFVSLLTVVTLASFPHQYSWAAIGANPSTLVLLAALTVFVVSLLHPSSVLSRALTTRWVLGLGTVSYTLYLAHPYSYLASRILVTNTGLSNLSEPFRFGTFSILTILSTAALVWVVHAGFEARVYKEMTGKEIVSPGRS
jgi:peptidoglycan/LPS O-acetylase OafA/YrhL